MSVSGDYNRLVKNSVIQESRRVEVSGKNVSRPQDIFNAIINRSTASSSRSSGRTITTISPYRERGIMMGPLLDTSTKPENKSGSKNAWSLEKEYLEAVGKRWEEENKSKKKEVWPNLSDSLKRAFSIR